MCHDRHGQTRCQFCGFPRDGANADETKNAASNLVTQPDRPRPGAGRHRAVGSERSAQQHQGTRHDILGDQTSVGPGRWSHLDAAYSAGRKVDIVGTDPRAARPGADPVPP